MAAATSVRLPAAKRQAPLRTLNRGSNFLRGPRLPATAKRKSAVELLQESKAFYVKSETVLDRKQELKNSGHLQVTSSVDTGLYLRGPLKKPSPGHWGKSDDNKYIHQHMLLLSPPPRPAPLLPPAPLSAPPIPPKSPRMVSAAQRRSCPHHSAGSDQLQTKLRRLLNADSKENLFFADTEHRYRRLWDEDDDVKTVAGDERRHCGAVHRQSEHIKSDSSCSVHHKSLPDLHASPPSSVPSSSPDTSLGSCQSSSWSASSERRRRRSAGSTPGDAMSTVSSGGRTHKSQPECSRQRAVSTERQGSDVFGLRPERSDSGHTSRSHTTTSSGRHTSSRSQLASSSSERHNTESGRRDVESASSYSDSGAEEVHSPSLIRCGEGRRPILRSKSDISHRYSRGPPPVPARPQPRSVAQLELFFEHLGLDNHDFRCLSAPASGSSSPVYFSSVSSVDSVTAWGPWAGCGPGVESGGSLRGGVAANYHRPCEQPSIVERNARIIKWLCNCRKAQQAAPGKTS